MSIALAMVLDALFGEPKWLWDRAPHPVVLIGRVISALEVRANQGAARKLKGMGVVAILMVGAFLLGGLLTSLPGALTEVLIGAILLAHRSLVAHVTAVADGLQNTLQDGRDAVAMIVSRDTATMDASAVARSTIESAAENLSDGVIAPLFWFWICGLPGLLIYKAINTADSMIGYRTERYRDFGWAAARLDDLLNWVPARLTAGLIWLTDRQTARAQIQQDAALHRSPNAGWPEAAIAYKHAIALAGPRSYDGQMQDFDYVNADGMRDPGAKQISEVTGTLWQVWGIMFALMLLTGLVF